MTTAGIDSPVEKNHPVRLTTSMGVLIALAAVIALNGCSGPAKTTVLATSGTPEVSTAPVPQSALLGSTLQVTKGDNIAAYTVSNLRMGAPSQYADYGVKPTGTIYTVDVTVQTQVGVTSVNALYFNARSADGTNFGAWTGTSERQIALTQLPQGQKLRGTVDFDTTAPITQIVLSGPLGEQLGLWTVG
ncbi:DUF1942 domain-containing protein [Mycolicibacterium llatzerense]|uniref:DUF1942 domain-containing protein n=1 Tax=Mycolicibacterium llatzerense TaxID=280871 RepID=UPI0021B5D2FE|nr:DUF1942 domain-containing protein [Mycolicibacterium llatzerense]MCT7361347.1 hypothetical protein [Mycolicibacterium llatzerense]